MKTRAKSKKDRKNFSYHYLNGLKPKKGKQFEVRDAKSDLILIVSPGGQKSYYFKKYINGRQVKEKIGTFPNLTVNDARNLTADRINAIKSGYTPDKAEISTLNELFKRSLSRIEKASTEERKRYIYEKYLAPEWGMLTASDITEDKVRAKYNALKKDTPEMAKTVIKLLRTIYLSSSDYNPCKGLRLAEDIPRDRALSVEELPRFFKACDNSTYREYFLFTLFTGQRGHSVRSIHKSQIDLNLKEWNIPAEHMKMGKAHTVPLIDEAIELLSGKNKPIESVAYHKYQWNKLCLEAELEDFHFHDLRATLSTWLDNVGASPMVCSRVLAHRIPGMTARYTRNEKQIVRAYMTKAVNAMLNPKQWVKEEFELMY